MTTLILSIPHIEHGGKRKMTMLIKNFDPLRLRHYDACNRSATRSSDA
jgi:hypothetical protein